MGTDLITQLVHLSPFSTLPLEDLKKIVSQSFCREIPAGEYVIQEGDEAQSAYFVLTGKMEVLRTGLSGREQVLALLDPGMGFNTAPFFLEEKSNPASVRAIVPAEALVIPGMQFMALLAEVRSFNNLVMRDYCEHLKLLAARVEELGLYSVRARLARFLLGQADRQADPLRWTQDEIARQIGTVRDVVGRSLRSLEAEGLIQLQRQQIRLLNRAALQKIADSE